MKRPVLIWTIVAVITVIGFIYFMMNLSYEKKDVDYREAMTAQKKTIANVKDKIWKVLKQKAGLLDKQENAFKAVFVDLMSERYEGEDQDQSPMFKWIKEQNPDFKMEMYMDMAAAIEANQEEFMEAQNRLIDIGREHAKLLRAPVSGHFLKDKDTVEVVVVVSSHTKKVMETGIDDDVDLFGSNKKEK